jgi:hypothetical protein
LFLVLRYQHQIEEFCSASAPVDLRVGNTFKAVEEVWHPSQGWLLSLFTDASTTAPDIQNLYFLKN